MSYKIKVTHSKSNEELDEYAPILMCIKDHPDKIWLIRKEPRSIPSKLYTFISLETGMVTHDAVIPNHLIPFKGEITLSQGI